MFYILFIPFIFFSEFVLADYTTVYRAKQWGQNVYTGYHSTGASACTELASIMSSNSSNYNYTFNSWGGYWCSISEYNNNGDFVRSSSFGNTFESTYDPSVHDPVTDPSIPTTDEQCLSMDPEYLKAPEGTGVGDIVSYNGCEWQYQSGTSDDSIYYPNGQFSAWYEPIGKVPEAPNSSADLDPEADYMQSNLYDPLYSEIEPTTDTSLDCPWSYVTDSNGDSFCYTGADANTGGAEYPDSSTRVEHYDGSYTITESDGTTTEYHADGSVKTPSSAPTTAGGESFSQDGSEFSNDAKGIISAISSLKKSVKDGFENIVKDFGESLNDTIETVASEGPDGENIEQVGTPEENATKAENAIDGVKDELMSLVDGTDSQFASLYATMQGYWGSAFPTIPEPSCSPLTFAPGTPYSFTIQCDVFDLIREALAWILYALTLYVIITTMFSARPS